MSLAISVNSQGGQDVPGLSSWPVRAAMHRRLPQKYQSRRTLADGGGAIHTTPGFCSTESADTANLKAAGSSEGVI
jgi:hypothetical protein